MCITANLKKKGKFTSDLKIRFSSQSKNNLYHNKQNTENSQETSRLGRGSRRLMYIVLGLTIVMP